MKRLSIFGRGQHWLPFFLSAGLSATPAFNAIQAAELDVYMNVESFSYSEPFSIKNTFDGWEGDFTPGKRQWTWNWLEAGVRVGHWGLGVVKRYDYDLRFSKDTARAIGLINNKEDLPTGRVYDVRLEANAINAEALRASYRSQVMGIHYEIGVSYLFADYMMDGELTGELTALAENDYEYRADVSYQYTEDVLFDRPLEDDATGEGFAIDVAFSGQLAPTLNYYMEIRDLVARIYWQDLPYTVAEATSKRRGFDDDGYVEVDPAIKGQEEFHRNYTQKLDPRTRFTLDWQFEDQMYATLDMRNQYAHTLYGVGSGYRWSAASVELLYWPESRSVSASADIHDWTVGVMVDDTDWQEFKTLMLNISYNHL